MSAIEVVSQFEIFAAVRRRPPSRLEVSGATACSKADVLSRKTIVRSNRLSARGRSDFANPFKLDLPASGQADTDCLRVPRESIGWTQFPMIFKN
jgi:hypothetical protein